MAKLRESTDNLIDAHISIKLVNSLLRLGQIRGLRAWKLDRNAILDSARKRTGLVDIGNAKYIDSMDRLINNAHKVDLTPLGELCVYYFAKKSAINRLYIEDYIENHPGVEDATIKSPIFITGFPRSGTTLLQNVLSLGLGYRALQLWELITPYPVHEDREKDRRTRIRKVNLPLHLIKMLAPGISATHDARADTKEECWLLLMNSLFIVGVDVMTGLHEWNDWLLAMDRSWVYEEYKRMLQLQAHITPTERFVLKCPSHLCNLEPLLKTFPDACIVWTHRNPVNSIASSSSVASLGRKGFFGYVDPKHVGEMVVERFHSTVGEAMKFRDSVGDDRFYDMNFETLVKDIPGAVRDIKKHFGLPHSKEADKAVREFLDQPRKDKPGKHVYRPEKFGLDPKEIVERSRDYIERFDIKVK